MGRQDHAVLDYHVCGFVFGVEEHRVRLGPCDVGRVAAEDSPVVRLWAVGVGGPVELAVDEVDAAGFVAAVRVGRDEDLP